MNILRQQIEEGALTPHLPIPSERQLEGLYNISRTTIRQAIEILTRQGFLYREHGRGTFVSPQKLQKGLFELISFSQDMRTRGLEPGQVILWVSKPLRRPRELPEDHRRVLHIERIRLGDGIPMGLQISCLADPLQY